MNLIIFGSRPDEIKLYPFTKYPSFRFLMVNQSKDLHQGLIQPHYYCEESELESMIEKLSPAQVIVQGDTRTTFRSAVYAFEHRIPVVHIEAGLRTFDMQNPFPEEFYRQAIDLIATKKYCSTQLAAKNCDGIYVGQTGIDTLHEFCGEVTEGDYAIVTLHRNETWDKLDEYIKGIKKAGKEYKLMVFAHPNIIGQELKHHFKCLSPMGYKEFTKLLAGCGAVITDSGGLQEEATALGKTCIVMREKSERSNDDIYTTGATKRIVEDLL